MTKEERQHFVNLVKTFRSYEVDYREAYKEDLDEAREFAYLWSGHSFAYKHAADELTRLVKLLDDK